MQLELHPITLRLRTTFRIAHGASDTRDNLLIRLGEGWGEAAPVAYHGESAAQVAAWFDRHKAALERIDDPRALRAALASRDSFSR